MAPKKKPPILDADKSKCRKRKPRFLNGKVPEYKPEGERKPYRVEEIVTRPFKDFQLEHGHHFWFVTVVASALDNHREKIVTAEMFTSKELALQLKKGKEIWR